MKKIVLSVEGMSCSHCVKAIKMSIGELDGALNVEVDLKDKTVEVEFEPEKLAEENIKLAIEDAGYNVVG